MKVMKIFLKADFNFTIYVDPKDKVSKLRRTVSPSDPTTYQLKFFFQGKELNDRTTLEENQICRNSSIILKLIKKQRGPGLFMVHRESWLMFIVIAAFFILVGYSEMVWR